MNGLHFKRNYFEGWYFKQNNGEHTIVFIPSYHIDQKGKLNARLQLITDNSAHCFTFPAEKFHFEKKPFCAKIGGSVFSLKGASLNIDDAAYKITGELVFGNLTAPKYDIMGPFAFVPLLQCRHSLISLKHTVDGHIKINDSRFDFVNGQGYIEGDRGSSFPERYLWTQCNINDTAVMLSIATVRALSINFLGAICSIYYKDKEYRIASYLGAKVLEFSEKSASLKQGKMRFSVTQLSAAPQILHAPVDGMMGRLIRESPSCSVRYTFSIGNDTVFDIISPNAGFEYSDNAKG
ncbi:MAG: hypothetical protein EOM87_01680 [Clostridia bacterium]|nr:hypothetical protein [Clostridia bacterium]